MTHHYECYHAGLVASIVFEGFFHDRPPSNVCLPTLEKNGNTLTYLGATKGKYVNLTFEAENDERFATIHVRLGDKFANIPDLTCSPADMLAITLDRKLLGFDFPMSLAYRLSILQEKLESKSIPSEKLERVQSKIVAIYEKIKA